MEVSHAAVHALVGAGAAAMVALIALGVAAAVRSVNVTRNRVLERENRVLLDEIHSVHDQEIALSESLATIGERDQKLRLLAGLGLLDPSVQLGGIGGPPGAWPERDSLLPLGADGAEAFGAGLEAEALGRRADILLRSVHEARESLSSHQTRLAATPSIMPSHGRVSSPFAAERWDPILHLVRPHRGMDVAAPTGSEIAAPATGVVKDVGWEEGYGNFVAIDHGYGIVTRFAHCSKILVVRGQRVTRGQKIALVGSTGESTGPHVHYEVWVNGKAVDPKAFVMPEDVITD